MNATIIVCTIVICLTIWISMLTLVLHSVWQTKTGRIFAVELLKVAADIMGDYLDKVDML